VARFCFHCSVFSSVFEFCLISDGCFEGGMMSLIGFLGSVREVSGSFQRSMDPDVVGSHARIQIGEISHRPTLIHSQVCSVH